MKNDSESGISHFRWQIPGRLAGVSFPGSPEALARLQQEGIGALVSLSETALPSERLAELGLQAVHRPIADFTAPSIAQIEETIAVINQFLDRGVAVAVHCGAGLGRTGTILACYLVSQGTTAEEALSKVRLRAPGSVETREQEAIIDRYAQHVQSSAS